MVQAASEGSWRIAVEYEKRLRAESRKRPVLDPQIRALRKSVREAYEAALFENYAFAQANDVEQALWKICYYRPIEDFRTRIKMATAAASGTAPQHGVTKEEAAKQLAKTATAYRHFLNESIVNYKTLIAKLQATYGDVGVDIQLEPGAAAQVAAHTAAMAGRAAEGAGVACQASVHRCLIYLGDLYRYLSQVRHEDPSQQARERSEAIAFYLRAAHVLPSSGNPYNQLAVMAYLNQQELLSVYYYFRALGVSSPFTTARENLLLLFESNRTRYGQLQTAGAVTGGTVAELSVRYVRVAGLLYDRINLETMIEVRQGCVQTLRAALADGPTRSALAASAGPADTSTLLQAACIVVFSAHRLSSTAVWQEPQGGSEHQSSASQSAAQSQHPFLRRAALTVLFDMASWLSTAASSQLRTAATSSTTHTSDPTSATHIDTILAPLNVLLSWLASSSSEPLFTAPLTSEPSRPASAAGASAAGPAPTQQNPLEEAHAAWHEVGARALFWRHATGLLRALAGVLTAPGGAGLGAGGTDGASALDKAMHHPPAEPLLPEESELAGFVPLAEAHALLPQPQRDGAAGAAGSGRSSSFSRAAAGNGSSRGSQDGAGLAATQPLQRPSASGSSHGLLRLQRVLFWLHRAAVKVAGTAGAGTSALANSVSKVALQNLEQALKGYSEAMEEVVAKAESAAAQPAQPAAPQAGTSAVPAAAVASLPAATRAAIAATAQAAAAAAAAAQQMAARQASGAQAHQLPQPPLYPPTLAQSQLQGLPGMPAPAPMSGSVTQPQGLQQQGLQQHQGLQGPYQPQGVYQVPFQDTDERMTAASARASMQTSHASSRDHSAIIRSVSSGTLVAASHRSATPSDPTGLDTPNHPPASPTLAAAAAAAVGAAHAHTRLPTTAPGPPAPRTSDPHAHPLPPHPFASQPATAAVAAADPQRPPHGPPPEQLPLPRNLSSMQLNGRQSNPQLRTSTCSSGSFGGPEAAQAGHHVGLPPQRGLSPGPPTAGAADAASADPATERAAVIAASLLRHSLSTVTGGAGPSASKTQPSRSAGPAAGAPAAAAPAAPAVASASGALPRMSVHIPSPSGTRQTVSPSPSEAPLVPEITPSNQLLWRASINTSSQPASPSISGKTLRDSQDHSMGPGSTMSGRQGGQYGSMSDAPPTPVSPERAAATSHAARPATGATSRPRPRLQMSEQITTADSSPQQPVQGVGHTPGAQQQQQAQQQGMSHQHSQPASRQSPHPPPPPPPITNPALLSVLAQAGGGSILAQHHQPHDTHVLPYQPQGLHSAHHAPHPHGQILPYSTLPSLQQQMAGAGRAVQQYNAAIAAADSVLDSGHDVLQPQLQQQQYQPPPFPLQPAVPPPAYHGAALPRPLSRPHMASTASHDSDRPLSGQGGVFGQGGFSFLDLISQPPSSSDVSRVHSRQPSSHSLLTSPAATTPATAPAMGMQGPGAAPGVSVLDGVAGGVHGDAHLHHRPLQSRGSGGLYNGGAQQGVGVVNPSQRGVPVAMATGTGTPKGLPMMELPDNLDL